jgi:heterodisulfide reductase subunit D
MMSKTVGIGRYKKALEKFNVVERCGKCGTCGTIYQNWRNICPAVEEYQFESYFLGGKNLLTWGLLHDLIQWDNSIRDVLYACTLCGHCANQCQMAETDGTKPMELFAMNILEAMRHEAVKAGFGPMHKHKMFGNHISKEYNPYLEKHRDRLNWLPKNLSDLPKEAEIVYYVGCTSSYREKNIAIATAKLFKHIGLNFAILPDEWCCGSPLFRTGQWEIAAQVSKHNIELMNKAGISMLTTSCAGCYRTWKTDYKDTYADLIDVDYNFDVLHTTELLADLIKKGEFEVEQEFRKKITYHDPCHLAHCGVYDPPRYILQNIPGVELVEMERIRENAWCCGAGGGVKSGFPEFALKTAIRRLEEAEETKIEAIVTPCPFCTRNLRDAAEKAKFKIEVYDVVEILARAIKP